MVIFDCNGVLVDSEPLAAQVASREFMRAGFALTPDIVARYFTGRRPADMLAEVEIAAGRRLPPRLRDHARQRDDQAFPHRAQGDGPRRARAVMAARAEMRGLLVRHRPDPGEPGDHRPAALLRTLPVLGERGPQRQAGAGPVPARRRQNAGRAEELHRGRGFAGRRRRRCRRRHARHWFRRRQPCRTPSWRTISGPPARAPSSPICGP